MEYGCDTLWESNMASWSIPIQLDFPILSQPAISVDSSVDCGYPSVGSHDLDTGLIVKELLDGFSMFFLCWKYTVWHEWQVLLPPFWIPSSSDDHRSFCFMPPSWRSHPSCLPCPWSLRAGKLVTLAASEAPTSSHIHIILVDTLIFTGFNQPCLPAVSSLHHFASFYIMIRGKFTGRRAPCMFLVASWPLHGAVPLVPLVGAFAPGGTSSARHVKSTGRTGSAGASRRPQWWKGGGQQLTRAPSNQWLIIDLIILYYYMIWLGDIGGMMGI